MSPRQRLAPASAEVRTPELVDLREAAPKDGAGTSRAESALGSLTLWSVGRTT
jgi:hypothetical protein